MSAWTLHGKIIKFLTKKYGQEADDYFNWFDERQKLWYVSIEDFNFYNELLSKKLRNELYPEHPQTLFNIKTQLDSHFLEVLTNAFPEIRYHHMLFEHKDNKTFNSLRNYHGRVGYVRSISPENVENYVTA